MPDLMWFRNDLRTIDNPALSAAATAATGGVIGIFVCTPGTWQRHDWGPPRVTLLLESLRVLRSELEQLNIPLLIRIADTDMESVDIVTDVATANGCATVHANREFGVDEGRRDELAGSWLSERNIDFALHHDQVVFEPDDILTKGGTSFKVFTPFRNTWNGMLMDRGLPEHPPLSPCESVSLASDPIPGSVPGFTPWPGITLWPAGQNAAMERLQRFLDGPVDRYHNTRNSPDTEGTSSLSPWLATGTLSPVTCLRPLVERFGPDPALWPAGPATWQSELVWRDFYRYVMHHNPKVSMRRPMQEWTVDLPWRQDDDGFEAWCNGRTGIEIVDAGMRQMLETGWMHNRVRMITAMFLTKNLLIDWRRGERFFARHLVDYDFASNNGGWQWSASTGTDAAPYFRIFNPDRQAELFDPDGTYRRRWNPDHHPLTTLPIVDLGSSRRRAIEIFKVARTAGC